MRTKRHEKKESRNRLNQIKIKSKSNQNQIKIKSKSNQTQIKLKSNSPAATMWATHILNTCVCVQRGMRRRNQGIE
jgi:predicted ribosome-associated RNA-binding protein Tma20